MTPPAPDSAPARRLRSALYMPGANERALVKACDIPADALILDLEDAVAPSAKADARARVCAAAASDAYGERTVTIRVNGIVTEWHDEDVAAAAQAGPHAIVVPKVAAAADVHAVEGRLRDAGAPEHTRIWAMLETPAAILRAAEIAAASTRLEVLVMGTNDLAAELYAEPAAAEPARGPLLAALSACVLAARATGRTILDGVYNDVRDPDGFAAELYAEPAAAEPARGPLLAALSTCVLAARATGRTILDGVYNDVRDPNGFAAECRQGRAYGFDGKTLIHPSQVEPCNEAFSPSAADVEYARRVIEAFEEAERAGTGVVTVDGRMIENLHVAGARRVLALAG